MHDAAHDIGGLEAGPVERDEHDPAYWERRVDALIYLLRQRGIIADTAELRRGIESLPADAYEKLSYYERWAASAATLLVEKGVLTQAQIDARVAAIRARLSG